ncbi:hypothetical protein TL16_g10466 [Triparma laevis f. inornata]|uniref:Uncharacterized protein n=1 Tax=Triparma laevis f. inornata TaxID=1714386 RepID=A0A9W7B8Q9_9STRA|nr:hypothetical protein TL16_g10466 [Triparma laevis f. inornata]
MTNADVLGYVGASLLAFAAPLQFITCLRAGSTRDISFPWLLLFLAGLALLISYAFILDLTPVWAPLLVEIAGTCCTLLLKLHLDVFDKREYTRAIATQTLPTSPSTSLPTSSLLSSPPETSPSPPTLQPGSSTRTSPQRNASQPSQLMFPFQLILLILVILLSSVLCHSPQTYRSLAQLNYNRTESNQIHPDLTSIIIKRNIVKNPHFGVPKSWSKTHFNQIKRNLEAAHRGEWNGHHSTFHNPILRHFKRRLSNYKYYGSIRSSSKGTQYFLRDYKSKGLLNNVNLYCNVFDIGGRDPVRWILKNEFHKSRTLIDLERKLILDSEVEKLDKKLEKTETRNIKIRRRRGKQIKYEPFDVNFEGGFWERRKERTYFIEGMREKGWKTLFP